MKLQIDLNEYQWFYEPDHTSILINEGYRKKILERAIQKAGSMTNLSVQTKLSKQTLFNHLYGKSMNVIGLKKILTFISFDFAEVNKYVEEISWNNIEFPIKLNTIECAVFFAAIIGDGSNTSRVMYKNKDTELLQKVEKNVLCWLGDVIIDHIVKDINIYTNCYVL